MNVQTAKNLKPYDVVYHTSKRNTDGTAMRARVTSVKTWKTRPNEVKLELSMVYMTMRSLTKLN